MSILLKYVRIYGFRGLENIEIDFEPTTILVGSNNSGKTTVLKALQLALTNSLSIVVDDFFYCDACISDKIIIDVLFIPVDVEFNRIDEFTDKWSTVFTTDKITITDDGKQILCFRTIIDDDTTKKTYRKKQYVIDAWNDFEKDGKHWYQLEYEKELNFSFDEIPFFYIDANRDILEDIKSKTSYLGKLLSTIEYEEADKTAIEQLIKDLNRITIEKSDVLTNIETTLKELDTAMDNPNNTVSLTPFTKKLKDLNKGVNINYSEFSMDYHGMGTRSWSSLLILKSFINFYKEKYTHNEKSFFPILAIEEPESHLHPNAQKKLYTQINNIAGQKIISTHSSYIAGCGDLKEIKSLSKLEENVLVGKIDVDSFTEPEDLRKIKRQVINTRGELFFSKIVVLFEGETEEQVLPVLVEKYFGKTSIELGVDFIGVGGYGGYKPFINFCESLNIHYLIFSDNEQEANKAVTKQISESKLNDIDKVVFMQAGNDFEKELIVNGNLDEVKAAYFEIELAKCTSPQHLAAKTIHLNALTPDDFYNEITKMKTSFAPVVVKHILISENPLPDCVLRLFDKINEILS